LEKAGAAVIDIASAPGYTPTTTQKSKRAFSGHTSIAKRVQRSYDEMPIFRRA
jgi:hypothetical protein